MNEKNQILLLLIKIIDFKYKLGATSSAKSL